jgi:hypothetical protein
MADLSQLQTALVNADKAGDTEAAKALAGEIIRMRTVAPEEKAADPTEGMSGTGKFFAGMGKAFVDTKRAVDQMTTGVGLGGAEPSQEYLDAEAQRSAKIQADIDESRRLDAPLMETGAGLVGNIAGKVAVAAPTALIPGANTIVGGALIGAGQGAVEPTATGESRLTNAGTGVLFGGGAATAVKGISRALRPKTSPEVQALMAEGITPTPGQVLGGGFRRAEEGMTSVPIVGDTIKSAQRRGIEDFNRAALNRALNPIGKAVAEGSPVGHEAVATAHEVISGAYNKLLPNLAGSLDDELVKSMSIASKDALNSLAEPQAKQFENFVAHNVLKRFEDDGSISGKGLKDIQMRLGAKIRNFASSQDPDHRDFADALRSVKDAVDDMIMRANPKQAPALKNVNSAYANLLRIERASGAIGAKEGVFTPAQLQASVRAMDASIRKRQFSHGEALMQDLSGPGKNVLSSAVPDSGTPYRHILNIGAAGGVGFLSPGALVGGLTVAGAYTKPGQKIMAALLAKRPDFIKNASPEVLEAARIAGQATSRAATGYGLSSDYQQKATELKQRMAKVKTDRALSNRQRREQLNEMKTEMNGLFKDAGQRMERTDFREFRSYVNRN